MATARTNAPARATPQITRPPANGQTDIRPRNTAHNRDRLDSPSRNASSDSSSEFRMRRSIPSGASTSRKPANTFSIASSEFFISCRLPSRAAPAAAFSRGTAVPAPPTRFVPKPPPSPPFPALQSQKAAEHSSPPSAISPFRTEQPSYAALHAAPHQPARSLATRLSRKALIKLLRPYAPPSIDGKIPRNAHQPDTHIAYHRQRPAMLEHSHKDVLHHVLGLRSTPQNRMSHTEQERGVRLHQSREINLRPRTLHGRQRQTTALDRRHKCPSIHTDVHGQLSLDNNRRRHLELHNRCPSLSSDHWTQSTSRSSQIRY